MAFLHSDLGHHTDTYWCGCMKLYLKCSKPVWLCFFCGTLKKIFCKSVGSQQHWTNVNYVNDNEIFPLTNKCYVTKTRRWRTKTNIWWYKLLQFIPCLRWQDETRMSFEDNRTFKIHPIGQGSSNLSLEGQSTAACISKPDQTQTICDFLMILKSLISMLRCVCLGLELKSAGVGQIWGCLL